MKDLETSEGTKSHIRTFNKRAIDIFFKIHEDQVDNINTHGAQICQNPEGRRAERVTRCMPYALKGNDLG